MLITTLCFICFLFSACVAERNTTFYDNGYHDLMDPVPEPLILHDFVDDLPNSQGELLNGLIRFAVPYYVSVQVQIHRGHKHLCGGTIVDEEFILTAAHCFHSRKNPKHLSVVAGTSLFSSKKTYGVRRQATHLEVHKSFRPLDGYDIALLRVKPKFNFTDERFAKINYNVTEDIPNDKDTYMIGLERVKPGGDQRMELIGFRTLNRDTCRKRGFIYVTQVDECATSVTGRGACDGDSGGPLLNKEFDKQLAILSYGREICQSGAIFAFTQVRPFVEWISENIERLRKLPHKF